VASTRSSSAAGRRAGYVVAVIVNAALLVVINVNPGWQNLSFVTDAADDVVGWVNLALAVGLVANLVYLVLDAQRVRAFGEVVVGVVGLIAAARLLQVFPFDFSGSDFPWTLLVRVVLWVAVLGSAVSVLVNVLRLFRGPVLERY
jgi:hypothetical protein